MPKAATGRMWDLTIPGNNDHNFYIDVVSAAVLVHNTECPPNPFHGTNMSDEDSLNYR
jgi:hypothetical protein